MYRVVQFSAGGALILATEVSPRAIRQTYTVAGDHESRLQFNQSSVKKSMQENRNRKCGAACLRRSEYRTVPTHLLTQIEQARSDASKVRLPPLMMPDADTAARGISDVPFGPVA